MVKYLFAFFCFLTTNMLLGQNVNWLELSGVVRNENAESISFVYIYAKSISKIVATDRNGVFSIIVNKADSVYFSSIGYKKAFFIIPQQFQNSSLAVEINMEPDTLMLEPIYIFPWKNYQQFKQAFIELKLKEQSNIERLQKNAELLKQYSYLEPTTKSEKFQYVMQLQEVNYLNKGLASPMYEVFNPVAWSEFFQQIFFKSINK